MQRRDFLTTAAAATTLATAATATADDHKDDHHHHAHHDDAHAHAHPGDTFQLNYSPHAGMFKHLGGADIVEQIEFAHAQGFRGWEDNQMPTRTPAEQERIGKALADHDMTMGVFVVTKDFKNVTFGKKNDAVWSKILDEIKAGVDIAKRCGAKWMTVVPGLSDRKLAWDYQTANCIELLRQCAEILEPHDLVMVLEPLNHRTNHPGLFLSETPQSYMICRAVDSPACKILYDIYHQQITEGHLIKNIDMAWDEIAYFQAGDNPGRKEPTTGEINYLNVFKHIHSKGFTGVVGMEHGNSQKGPEGEQAVIDAYRAVDRF